MQQPDAMPTGVRSTEVTRSGSPVLGYETVAMFSGGGAEKHFAQVRAGLAAGCSTNTLSTELLLSGGGEALLLDSAQPSSQDPIVVCVGDRIAVLGYAQGRGPTTLDWRFVSLRPWHSDCACGSPPAGYLPARRGRVDAVRSSAVPASNLQGAGGVLMSGGGAVTGDRYPGFEAFVAARGLTLLRSAYLITGDRQAAEDLVQAALERTASHWNKVRDDPEPYVRRVMYHQHVSWWRRRSRRPEVTSENTPDVQVAAHDAAVSLAVSLQSALSQLTARQRAVVLLRYYEDLTEAQAADALGCSVGTVKSTLHLALRRLRAASPELADGYPVPGRNAL